MKENTSVPAVEELAALVERAERACKTTAELVQDFSFIVGWYQSRPRRKLRPEPIFDQASDQEQTQDSSSDPLDLAEMLGPSII
jgi:hypothetical protein